MRETIFLSRNSRYPLARFECFVQEQRLLRRKMKKFLKKKKKMLLIVVSVGKYKL
ncbi:unnamed protein product [Amoebophrya sp. A25]|nr:unnamed protein product [Amoebophrya sp. A25]|eukprot:GSA25T00018547001.1